jgi:cardiolipin synthase
MNRDFHFGLFPILHFSRVMYSTLHSNFLARPLRSLAFVSRRPIIQSSLYTSPFQLKTRHRNVFTAATRSLSTSCVRWSDRKTDDTKGSAVTPPLRENVYTIPNLLTVSRILSCPVLGWSILHDDFYLATGLLVYAGLSDLVGPS